MIFDALMLAVCLCAMVGCLGGAGWCFAMAAKEARE